MLPTEDSPIVGEELARRFGLPLWQIASSATDANRFALRLARQATDRQKILVFDWCYHGTVDETLVTLDAPGHVGPREGTMGPPVDPALTTKVVPFNDVDALARRSRRATSVRPRGTGDDEHRHHPSGARLPRRVREIPVGPARCSSSTRRTRSARDPAATQPRTASSRTC